MWPITQLILSSFFRDRDPASNTHHTSKCGAEIVQLGCIVAFIATPFSGHIYSQARTARQSRVHREEVQSQIHPPHTSREEAKHSHSVRTEKKKEKKENPDPILRKQPPHLILFPALLYPKLVFPAREANAKRNRLAPTGRPKFPFEVKLDAGLTE